jgi:hypothetical protein
MSIKRVHASDLVIASIDESNPAWLQCLINRAAARHEVIEEIDTVLSVLMPYRRISPLIFEGVQMYRNNSDLSFPEISRRLCGNDSLKYKLSRWHRKIFGGSPDAREALRG